MKWITLPAVLAIHEELIAEHGGLVGLNNPGALGSALARPQQSRHYTQSDLSSLAAVFAVAIAKNHPFADGNKRTAFVVALTFLLLNGFWLEASEAEATLIMVDVAAGKIGESQLGDWFRHRLKRIAPDLEPEKRRGKGKKRSFRRDPFN
jgi:death-on-curing protein